MKDCVDPCFAGIQRTILRVASLLVPHSRRGEWLAEWIAELWYLLDTRRDAPYGRMQVRWDVTRFSLGAFRDAVWLRRNNAGQPLCPPAWLRSPVRCIAFLTALAVISVFFAFYLPGTRSALLPSSIRDEHNLVTISPDRRALVSQPPVSFEQYQALLIHLGPVFTGLAYYRPILTDLNTDDYRIRALHVAVASDNLFDLLGIAVTGALPERDGVRRASAKLLFTRAAWRKYLKSDPHIAGRVLQIAGQTAVVAGVVADYSSLLPGAPDAWLLESQAVLAATASESKGFVLGSINTSSSHGRAVVSPHAKRSWLHLWAPNGEGIEEGFGCEPLVNRGPVWGQLFMIGIALLILPNFTKLSLGEYPVTAHSPSQGVRSRRWIFLSLKVGLILPIVFFGTIGLGPVIGWIQPQTALAGYVIAFRWILMDQRQRCPVCLRLLSSPARIGQRSSTLLEWYGTEMICPKGHGLLHVNEVSTTSFGNQKWLYLDSSWQSLFSSVK